jgi:hypothetical protein
MKTNPLSGAAYCGSSPFGFTPFLNHPIQPLIVDLLNHPLLIRGASVCSMINTIPSPTSASKVDWTIQIQVNAFKRLKLVSVDFLCLSLSLILLFPTIQ